MSMNQDKIKALALELAKDIKTPEDLAVFSSQLTKITVETALSAKMQAHLGYAPHEAAFEGNANNRNGYSPKTLKGVHGEITINTPRSSASCSAFCKPIFELSTAVTSPTAHYINPQ